MAYRDRSFNDFDWSQVAHWLGGRLLSHDRKRRQVEIMLPGSESQGGGWLLITDNGGEVNLFRHKRVGSFIGYWNTGFDVGEATLATRIHQMLQGGPVDWETDWDRELRANPKKDAAEAVASRYASAHWGLEPKEEITVDDDDLPPHLVAMGNLREIKLKDQDGTKVELDFTKSDSPCWLAFSPDEDERLYCILPAQMMGQARSRLIVDGGKWYRLGELASYAPGRQNDWDYPNVQVQCLGWVTHVVYLTDKKGDGVSSYIHKLGEESGQLPLLAVDRKGRLWWAGGDYTVPDPGITN